MPSTTVRRQRRSSQSSNSRWSGYAIALAAVGLATLLSILLVSYGQLNRIYLFLAAVVVTALYGGLVPALFATVLSAVSINSDLYPDLSFADVSSFPTLLTFLGAALVTSYLVNARYENENRFRNTFEQAAVGIGHTDLTGRFIRVNDRMTEITGYTKAELLRLRWQDITLPDDLNLDQENMEQLAEGKFSTYSMEKRYISKQKEVIWVNVTVSLVRTSSGKPDYFIKVLDDIRRRKEAEAQVQQLATELEQRVEERTRELEILNQQLQTFTYSVSHDLRAPLRAIEGFSTILLESYADKLDSEGQEYARRLVNAAVNMDKLIEDLLAYSRLQRSEIAFQAVSLDELIDTVLVQFQAEMKEAEAQVNVMRPLPVVVAHPATLIQVVSNLLSNALKFVPTDRSPSITVRGEVNGKWARLCIEDEGIGIDPEHYERIFRIFERLHGGETYPGTGIGLAIVAKGVERMGGHVGVSSTPSEGSQFWIELPQGNKQ